MLETKTQMLNGADPHWMVVHFFFASQSEENSDSRFAQRLLECLPTEEKPVTWAHAEGYLKKLRAPPLGRYAGRAISSHKKQILSWITAGMQRTMMNIPGVDNIFRMDSPAGLCRKPWVGVAAVVAHLSENRSQSQSERVASIRLCAGLGHLQLLAHCGTTEEKG